jgi:hypothetical protein
MVDFWVKFFQNIKAITNIIYLNIPYHNVVVFIFLLRKYYLILIKFFFFFKQI